MEHPLRRFTPETDRSILRTHGCLVFIPFKLTLCFTKISLIYCFSRLSRRTRFAHTYDAYHAKAFPWWQDLALLTSLVLATSSLWLSWHLVNP